MSTENDKNLHNPEAKSRSIRRVDPNRTVQNGSKKKSAKKRRRKYNKHQLLLLGIYAIAIIAVIAIAVTLLTGRKKAKTIEGWPKKQFEEVPVLADSDCSTEIQNNKATISLPNATDDLLDDYEQTLILSGAVQSVDSSYVSVFIFNEMDILVIRDETMPQIVLMNEPTIEPNMKNWEDIILPTSGRIVKAEEDEENNTLSLSCRGLNLNDIISYADLLMRDGWVIGTDSTGISADGENGIYYRTFRKGSDAITVDYYANVMECLITLRSNIDAYDSNFNQ